MAELWKIKEYETVLSSFLASCEKGDPLLYAEARSQLRELQEKGNETSMPVSEPLGDKLFTLRPHTDEVQARLIYYFSETERKAAVFVNCFIKQTRAIPRHEIEIAKRRRKELVDAAKARKQGKKHETATRIRSSNGNRTYH